MPEPASNRLFAFYDWCARADVPEVTRLARTIEAWWPQMLAFIDTGITNARTEATSRMIKDAQEHECDQVVWLDSCEHKHIEEWE